ncbi:MAG: hypothetical protein NVS2B12_25950 [Ktedonobacteraceae bacterium]
MIPMSKKNVVTPLTGVRQISPLISANHKWNWQDALYLLALGLLVVLMAYHYTPHLAGEVAGEWWDPLLNMWTLSWNTTTLLHNPLHLWQAQLLYPNPLTLSYSENLLGETPFFAPFFLITHNPVLSYNVVFYLTFLLCATNMYILARYHTGKAFAAFVAALIYAFAPYRLGEIDHIHVIAGEWIPLVLLYLDLSLKQGKWRHWSLFAIFYLLQLLSSIYYGIFLSYTLLAYIIIRYTRPLLVQVRQQRRKYLAYLLAQGRKPAVVFTVMLVTLGLLMAPYILQLSSGLARSISQTANFSAFVSDFRFATPFNWLYGISSYNGVPLQLDNEHYLFLGLTTMGLAGLGTILAWRRHELTMRAFFWTGLIVLLFAFGPVLQFSTSSGAPLISGPNYPDSTHIHPPNLPMPWYLAYYVLPGFKGLRVPARLIGVLLVILALLAAYGVAWLQEMRQSWAAVDMAEASAATTIHEHDGQNVYSSVERCLRPAGGSCILALATTLPLRAIRTIAMQCVLILLPLAILLEAVPAYLPVTQVPTGNAIPAVYQWLATHGDQQPIVELPMAHLDENFSTRDEAWYDYYAIYHSHPIMNGWSGYRPPLTTYIAGVLLNFPSADSLAILKRYAIRYVVLHLQLYKPATAAALLPEAQANPGLQLVAVFNSDYVWQVK